MTTPVLIKKRVSEYCSAPRRSLLALRRRDPEARPGRGRRLAGADPVLADRLLRLRACHR